LIVGYDPLRGEPRGRLDARREGLAAHGDCIDCAACVITCPTGIDIRDGLQMECIHCTQCIDACDQVMRKVGKPEGLIRYGSRDEFDGRPKKILRPRIVIYPLIFAAALTALVVTLSRRTGADVTVLRGIGAPFSVLPSGEISNQLRVKIVNRSGGDRSYLLEIVEAPDLTIVAPENPVPVADGKSSTATVFVTGAAAAFPNGERGVRLRVGDGAGFSEEVPYRLLGPGEPGDEEER
jgi:cytochrome c oxidase accessory protein FixG